MQEYFDRFLGPVAIEGREDTARAARLLHLVLLSVLVFVTLNSAGVFLIYKRKLAVSIILLALLATAGCCFLLMRFGRVRLASAILVFGLWCIAATHVALNGGLRSPSSFFFLATCVFAALLLGSRGVLACAVLTIAATTGMLIAESLGHPMPQYFFVLPLPTFITLTVTLLFVLVPLCLLLSELRNALGLAQEQLKQREEADAALRESEDRYRDLVEHSTDLICTHTLEGRLLSVNELPAKLLGYSREEMLNKPMRDFLLPEARAQFDESLLTIQRDSFVKGVMVVLTKSGERRTWEYHNTLRTDGVSVPIVRGIAHDVTEQRRMQKALRLSEEKFSKAFLASPYAIVISTTEESRLIEVNDGFLRTMGFSREEAIGRTSLELGLWICPSDRQEVLRAIRDEGRVQSKEILFRTKDGKQLVVNYSAEVIDLGGSRCVLSVCEDITERRRAEEELRKSEERLRLAVQAGRMFAYEWDAATDVIVRSEGSAKILGIDEMSHITGGQILANVHPGDRERLTAAVVVLTPERPSLEISYRMIRPDDSVIWAEGTSRAQFDDKRGLLRIVGIVADITERKRAEEELRRLSGQLLRLQDEERRRIARDLHDSTGQDLVALATTLSQLHASIPSSGRKLRRLASRSHALADRCIREVRTLSYLLHPPMLDEAGLEDAIRHYAEGFAERTGIEVGLEVSPHFGRLSGDEELGLFRVVQESLINIQRHSGSYTAKIQLNREPKGIELQVSDAGRGIAANKRNQNGTIPVAVGVGIPSMEERVKQVGGRLNIESSRNGTTVRVTLPRHG